MARTYKAQVGPFKVLGLVGTVAVLVSTASACLPNGLALLGLDFDAFELASYQSCDDLESDLKARAMQKAQVLSLASVQGRAYDPTLGAVGAGQAPPFTGTNAQERGVDEADIFKVDANFAYALKNEKLVIVEAARESGSRITGGEIVSRYSFDGVPFDMFVSGDRAAVLFHTTQREVKEHFQAGAPSRDSNQAVTKVALLDIRDRKEPRLIRELLVEGEYVGTRRVGDRVYVIAKAMLAGPETEGDPSDQHWLKNRQDAIRNASLDAWMPYYYTVDYDAEGEATAEARRCSCEGTYGSKASEGDDALAVYSFGLKNGDTKVETATIIGDGAMVYSSTEGLVVSLNNYTRATVEEPDDGWGDGWGDDDGWDWDDEESNDDSFQGGGETYDKPVTYIHRFELKDDGNVAYQASGQVDGWALNQFSFSEHRGYLRVATQITDPSTGARETGVFVLKVANKDQARWQTFGKKDNFLSVVGEVRGIGYDEQLYAVRFLGDIGYVVTFRQTDPLYTIDLSSPTNPVVKGELQVPGYSTYLHPMEGGYLLAIGRQLDGWDDGIKLSLFDVTKLSSPDVVEELSFGDASATSEAIADHRAFRFLPDRNLMIIPVELPSRDGLHVYTVSPRSGIELKAVVGANYGHNLRAYTIGDYLYGYSTEGISIVELDSLETVAQVDID